MSATHPTSPPKTQAFDVTAPTGASVDAIIDAAASIHLGATNFQITVSSKPAMAKIVNAEGLTIGGARVPIVPVGPQVTTVTWASDECAAGATKRDILRQLAKPSTATGVRHSATLQRGARLTAAAAEPHPVFETNNIGHGLRQTPTTESENAEAAPNEVASPSQKTQDQVQTPTVHTITLSDSSDPHDLELSSEEETSSDNESDRLIMDIPPSPDNADWADRIATPVHDYKRGHSSTTENVSSASADERDNVTKLKKPRRSAPGAAGRVTLRLPGRTGRGTWRFDASLLAEKETVQALAAGIAQSLTEFPVSPNSWDDLKTFLPSEGVHSALNILPGSFGIAAGACVTGKVRSFYKLSTVAVGWPVLPSLRLGDGRSTLPWGVSFLVVFRWSPHCDGVGLEPAPVFIGLWLPSEGSALI
ncbi:hypothetical protein HPB47_020130 [Ixodes persulcatus]|uniref:Uncharacterized protein n=1 Tax=Ixodes persulcatus TaxID=34615 RepID=A0AC60QG79_IXOPE|nr:hypothetical protein HPB47_020130 [Ixodes persulcatus]